MEKRAEWCARESQEEVASETMPTRRLFAAAACDLITLCYMAGCNDVRLQVLRSSVANRRYCMAHRPEGHTCVEWAPSESRDVTRAGEYCE